MRAEDINSGLSSKRLKELFSYDEKSGIFTRKTAPCRAVKVGDVAGSISKDDGYVRISIDGRRYLAHRLAWLYVKGEWPADMIDHDDGNKSNNAIANLREANNSQNICNSPVRKDNFLGIKGVRLHETGRYHARIFVNGKWKSLGLHDSAEVASAAYEEAAKKYFGQFARAS